MDILYRVIEMSPSDPGFETTIRPIIECDHEVYGMDPSWQEGKTCVACSEIAAGPVKWTFDAAPERCPACGGVLSDFWPVEGLMADYRADAGRADYAFVAAYAGGRAVGAFRGWSMDAEELDRHLNEGLDARLRAHPSVAEALRARFPDADRFAYESSIFVLPSLHGRGIGKRLTMLGQQVLWDRGLRAFVMRTKTDPPAVTYPWYRDRLRYEQVAAYADADARVVLARAHPNRP